MILYRNVYMYYDTDIYVCSSDMLAQAGRGGGNCICGPVTTMCNDLNPFHDCSITCCAALLAALVTFFMMRRGRQRRVGLDDGNKPMQIDVKAFDDIESLKSTSSLAVSNVPAQGDNGDPVLQWIHSRQHKVEVLSASSSSNGSQSPGSQHHHRLHRTWSPTTEDSAKQSTHAVEIPEFLSNLEFSWDEIHVVRSLGVGSFGKVFLAKWNETPVAVKVLLDARELSASAGGHGSGVLSHTSYVAAASPSKLLEVR